MELPRGVDMQSVHAGACFVWVGRWCLGSILDSILEYFGLPNPSYTHFGPPFGRNRGPKSCIVMECDLRCHSGAQMVDFGRDVKGGETRTVHFWPRARKSITILLHYYYIAALYCSTALLYYCITVLVYLCITVVQYYCITVLLY